VPVSFDRLLCWKPLFAAIIIVSALSCNLYLLTLPESPRLMREASADRQDDPLSTWHSPNRFHDKGLNFPRHSINSFVDKLVN